MNRADAQHTRNPKPGRIVVEDPSQGIAVAVLPFENLSGSEINDYFARGFVEELMTDLSQFQSLRIISSYTARKLRGRDGEDALEASRELGIRFLLRGALIRRKDHLRITSQLIDVETGGLLWTEKFDAPTDDIFPISGSPKRKGSGLSWKVRPGGPAWRGARSWGTMSTTWRGSTKPPFRCSTT